MILNVSKTKTESLLLFCKDLILSYKDRVDVNDYGIDKDVIEKFNNIGNDMLKQILNVTFPQNYYLQNRKHYRIKAVLDGYNFINDEISKNLKEQSISALFYIILSILYNLPYCFKGLFHN